MTQEEAIQIFCNGVPLVGILHRSQSDAHRGMVIVVGGPQYRVGSHRQFILLARFLAESGVPVLRFDHRGIGDSDGLFLGFEQIDDDLAVAIDALMLHVPSIKEVVLWGLCDAASAILLYAHTDPRVTGIAILNPWIRSDTGIARVYLKHYYLGRILDRALWQKIVCGKFDVLASVRDLFKTLLAAMALPDRALKSASSITTANGSGVAKTTDLADRMANGLRRYRGEVLLILSGNDLTAHEFTDATTASRRWSRLLTAERISRHDLKEADHTFSLRRWHDEVVRLTKDWLASW